MKLEKQLIMTIGMTHNNWELTKEMVINSVGSFNGAPIVWNKKEEFKNYNGDMNDYRNYPVVGFICDNPNIEINDDKVLADIWIEDKYKEKWNGKFDNWCIQFDDKTKFTLFSIEVF